MVDLLEEVIVGWVLEIDWGLFKFDVNEDVLDVVIVVWVVLILLFWLIMFFLLSFILFGVVWFLIKGGLGSFFVFWEWFFKRLVIFWFFGEEDEFVIDINGFGCCLGFGCLFGSFICVIWLGVEFGLGGKLMNLMVLLEFDSVKFIMVVMLFVSRIIEYWYNNFIRFFYEC